MIVRISLLLLLTALPFGAMAGEFVSFYMDIWRYQGLRGQAYVSSHAEVHIAVDGESVVYRLQEEDSTFQASVNIRLALFKLQGGDSTQVFQDELNLLSAKLTDTTQNAQRSPFIYVQAEPPALEDGRYVLRAELTDNHVNNGRRSQAVREFDILPTAVNQFRFSDVKFFVDQRERLNPMKQLFSLKQLRNNFIPFVTNATFFNKESLRFYVEVYNVDRILGAQDDYFLRARIMQRGEPIYSIPEVALAKPVSFYNSFYDELDISLLPSGTYYLQVEVVDNTNNQNKTVRSMSEKFYVINSRKDPGFDTYVAGKYGADIFAEYSEEELNTYLRTLVPISTEQERRFIETLLRPSDPVPQDRTDFLTQLFTGDQSGRERQLQKRNYLYSFWEKRKETPNQSVASLWNSHLVAVKYCNQHFGSDLREGWQTDRGRVFLKYKIPSDLERFPSEPNMVPYERWQYDRLDQQSKVEFIFYDPDLTDEYQLLHSNKYGEVYNPRWQEQLLNRGRVPGSMDYEQTNRMLRSNTKLDPNH